MSAGAQSLLPGSTSRVNQTNEVAKISPLAGSKHITHRTTSASGGWYDYVTYMDTLITLGGPINSTARSAPYLWNDSTSQDAYSGGVTAFNTLVSYAYIFDPTFSGFHTYFDLPNITSSKPYTVDSIGLYGIYGMKTGGGSIVDTLKVGYVYGSVLTTGDDILRSEFDASFAASLLVDYSVPAADTLWFPMCEYDSVTNTGMGTTYQEQIITISSAATSNSNINFGDSLAGTGGVYYHAFKLNTPAAVPAGQVLGVTVSFKSGDPTFAFGDVVFTSTSTYNYNMWRPLLAYYSDASNNPVFFPYNPADNNTGLYKSLPNYSNGWENVYVPMWAWNSGGGASTLQYPVMDLHVECPTCAGSSVANVGNIQSVQAVPNPAASSTSINFKLDQVANVTVSLTDVTGQVVATQKLENVSNGKAFISTANLPSGVYFYTVTANGKRSTGRVVVAH